MSALAPVLRSEWAKLLSLRSTRIALAAGLLLALALTALLAVVAGATADEWSAEERASWDPASASLIGGLVIAIVLSVLAVTAATGEHATGTIRLTLTVTPRRGRVLAAKCLVIAGIALVVGLAGNLAMFLLGQAMFGAYGLGTADLGDGDALRLVVGGGALTPVLPVVALLVGLVLRAAAASVTALFALVFGLPVLSELLPRWWREHGTDLMLLPASDALTNPEADGLAPGVAALVLAAWMALLVAGTWAALERRDP